jgi:hypothetical protein
MVTGRWVDFVARVKWHLPDGIVEVWMDGAKKVSATGINTWYTSGHTKVKPQLGYYSRSFADRALLPRCVQVRGQLRVVRARWLISTAISSCDLEPVGRSLAAGGARIRRRSQATSEPVQVWL